MAKCLQASDCVQVHGHTGKECLTDHRAELPIECQQAYKGFVQCKRSLWDMRKRYVSALSHSFRGIPGAEYSESSTMFAALDKRGS